MVYFDLYNVNPDFSSMLPADLDGWTPPPAGSPNTFAEVDDALSLGPVDALRLWEFHVDWTNTASSTFGAGGQPNAVLPVDAFDWLPCVPAYSLCIPQPGTPQKLDGIGDRLMYRLAYRNFGDHESLVVNHTVKADGIDRAGVRWYEVRDPGGAPVIHQQGTFAPNDGLYRWMGSLAMDRDGNIALGYSVSGASMYPSIRYTGRLATDPPGQMAQNEGIVITGTGVQMHYAGRWGDYSMMAIDPLDDCTFWYTNETIQSTGSASWQTRIAAWKFPTCALPDYGLVLQPPMSKTADPGAVITFTLPVTNVGAKTDTYTVTVSGNAWPITAPQSLGPLSTGQTVDMQITTSVPLIATGGMTDTATIALTSQGAVTLSVTTTVTTIARYRYYFPWFFKNGYPP